jgi:hypothetical protein
MTPYLKHCALVLVPKPSMLTYEVGSTLPSYIISLKNTHYTILDASLDWCAHHLAVPSSFTLSLWATISTADNAKRSEIDMFSTEQEHGRGYESYDDRCWSQAAERLIKSGLGQG